MQKTLVVAMATSLAVFVASPATTLAQSAIWTSRPVTTGPDARMDHAMAYDAASGRVVLFGGSIDNGQTLFGDSWLWDGGAWEVELAIGPPPRQLHAMAYDALHHEVVLFGGGSTTDALGDTWVRDSISGVWSEASPGGPNDPSPRWEHAMTHDPVRNRVVLFGGADYFTWKGDTWVWDGELWDDVSPPLSPPARGASAMAFDPQQEVIVLFGGSQRHDHENLGDTWVWDGTTWSQKFPPGDTPGPRRQHTMACDAASGRIILFGGIDNFGAPLGDTWEWYNNQWHRRDISGPSPRTYHAMAGDEGSGTLVLFGGGPDILNPMGDTWVYGICPADLSGDGLVDFVDFLAFLNYYIAQSPVADFTGDGLVDFSDYLAFLNHYDAGC